MEAPQKAPRGLGPTLLLCMVLGMVGSFTGCAGVLAWRAPLQPLPVAPLPERPEGVSAERWAQVEEAYARLPEVQLDVVRQRRPALNALAVVNLVSSTALLFGAQLARRRLPQGLGALRTGLVLSEAYAVIALFVTVGVQRDIVEAMRPHLLPLQELPFLSGVLLLAQVLSAAVLLAQLAFYAFVHVWIGRPHVAAALRPPGPA